MCKVFHIIHLGGVYMYKKIAVSMTMAALLCGVSTFPASATTPKEVAMHHHKPISEEEMQSLEKLGYNKHEIWKAAHIARISKKETKDVLAYYKQNKSWEKTALDDVLKMKKDGMDIKQIAEKLNVKREDIRAEMIKLVKSIKEKQTN